MQSTGLREIPGKGYMALKQLRSIRNTQPRIETSQSTIDEPQQGWPWQTVRKLVLIQGTARYHNAWCNKSRSDEIKVQTILTTSRFFCYTFPQSKDV